MLASAQTVEVVAQALKDYKVETLVLDPVSILALTYFTQVGINFE